MSRRKNFSPSGQVIEILCPVILSALYSCVLVKLLDYRPESNKTSGPFSFISHSFEMMGISTNAPNSSALDNVYIVLVLISMIVFISLIILVMFYMRWHICLLYYFYVPTLMILTVVTPLLLREILIGLNCYTMDLFTLLILTWNFTALGVVAIFEIYTRAPHLVRKLYLVHNSAVLVVVMVHILPGWAPWMMLAFLVIWDLFAVLTPYGPLNMILDMAEREGIVDMPGLIYTTNSQAAPLWGGSSKRLDSHHRTTSSTKTTEPKSSDSGLDTKTINSQIDRPEIDGLPPQIAEEEKSNSLAKVGIKNAPAENSDRSNRAKSPEDESSRSTNAEINIGLGDFVFYSLLIAMNSRSDNLYATLAALVAVSVGILATLLILAVTRRALPALPISISLGLIITLICNLTVPQFSNRLASEMVFV